VNPVTGRPAPRRGRARATGSRWRCRTVSWRCTVGFGAELCQHLERAYAIAGTGCAGDAHHHPGQECLGHPRSSSVRWMRASMSWPWMDSWLSAATSIWTPSGSMLWVARARWYSLISPVTTGLRRTDRRSATSQLGCVSMSGGAAVGTGAAGARCQVGDWGGGGVAAAGGPHRVSDVAVPGVT